MVQTISTRNTLEMEMEQIISERRMNNIGVDVQFEILTRLPVRSVLRFKSVCKSWYSFIHSPDFIPLHFHPGEFIRVCSWQNLFYFINKDGVAVKLSHHIPLPHNSFRTSTSCNGFLCFIGPDRTVIVCNPVTKETITLGKPTYTRRCDLDHSLGFGFDSATNSYKVVVWDAIFSNTKAEIFTLGTKSNSWRRIESPPRTRITYKCARSTPIYANGASHWYAIDTILSFSFAKEKFSVIPVPDDPRCQPHITTLIGEVGGCLCFVKNRDCDPTVKMWVLKEYEKQEWTCRDILLPFGNVPVHVLAIGNGQILINLKRDGRITVKYLCCYDEKGGVTKSSEVPGLNKGMLEVPSFHFFRESFLSLKGA